MTPWLFTCPSWCVLHLGTLRSAALQVIPVTTSHCNKHHLHCLIVLIWVMGLRTCIVACNAAWRSQFLWFPFWNRSDSTSLPARKIIKLLHLSFGHNHNLPPNQINPSHSISSQYVNILKSISSPSPLKLFILYSYFNAKERTRHFKCIKQQKKDK